MINKEAEGFLDALLLSIKNAKLNIICVEEFIISAEDTPETSAINNAFKNIKLLTKCLQSNTEFLLENCEDYDLPFLGESGL
ncbi:MAG: hypothetical protein LBC64_07560 [Fibromonadaceae bacterium]|jgi:hypothetical protein|nr:hypothetical protein [Fibromonadaceae bacterium]